MALLLKKADDFAENLKILLQQSSRDPGCDHKVRSDFRLQVPTFDNPLTNVAWVQTPDLTTHVG